LWGKPGELTREDSPAPIATIKDQEHKYMPIPEPSGGETEDEFVSRCMADANMQEYPQEQRSAICYGKYRGESREALAGKQRHPDFLRIHDEFVKYYCKGEPLCRAAEDEYYAFIKDYGLDETKAYGAARESFSFARDMIKKWKEDSKNVYYKVLVGFPVRSMNENDYNERALIAAAHTLVGVPIDMNHKSNLVMPGVEYVAAEYEDGAVEAVLKVPKSTVCPVCGGTKPLHQMIDSRGIVNVSLEAESQPFRFTGCALLTTEVLPGIPMARIYPLEMRESLLSKAMSAPKTFFGKRVRIQVVGLNMTKKKEQSNPDGNMQCPQGQHFSPAAGQCVPDQECGEGQVWDADLGKCRPIETPPPEDTTGKAGTVEQDYPWDQCIADMKDQGYTDDQAAATCAAIKNRTVSHAMLYGLAKNTKEARALVAKKVKEDKLFAYLAGRVHELSMSENTLEIANLKVEKHRAEQKAQAMETRALEAEKKFAEEANASMKASGRILELERAKSKLEDQARANNEDKIKDATQIKELGRRLQDAGENLEALKQNHDILQRDYGTLETKYRDTLQQNLDFSKRLTQTNEEYLASEKEKAIVEEKLKKAKRLGKFIVKT
jgi:hypothetical protein